MAKAYAFTREVVRRILAVVRRVEQMPLEMVPEKRPIVRSPTTTPGRTPYMIVCLGPNDETAPTDNDYWAQPMTLVDVDADEPADPTSSGTIERLTNLGESQTATHLIHVGEVVDAWRMVDAGSTTRLVCTKVP